MELFASAFLRGLGGGLNGGEFKFEKRVQKQVSFLRQRVEIHYSREKFKGRGWFPLKTKCKVDGLSHRVFENILALTL